MYKNEKIQQRLQLISQIEEWNAVRIDLFGLSIPDDNLEFNGVMRFFYMGSDGKYQTKCLRITSSATTKEIIKELVEKFHPAGCDSPIEYFGLYEHHGTGDDRKLSSEESPLYLQLSWINFDREGKLVLKNQHSSPHKPILTETKSNQNVIKRRWSFRKDGITKNKKSTTTPSFFCNGGMNYACHIVKSPERSSQTITSNISINPEPPDSTFTRTISDPEAAMKRKRQKTLEAKIMNIINEGGLDTGGALKIYGASICPEIPYKTILVSYKDDAAQVIRQSLEKYGIENADPNDYYLVLRLRNVNPLAGTQLEREKILHPTDRPLETLQDVTKSDNFSALVELRRKEGSIPRSVTTETLSEFNGSLIDVQHDSPVNSEISSFLGAKEAISLSHLPPPKRVSSLNLNKLDHGALTAYLIELTKDGSEMTPSKRARIIPIVFRQNQAIVLGTASKSELPDSKMLQLPLDIGKFILPHHAVLWTPVSSSPSPTKQQSWLLIRPYTDPKKSCIFVNGKQVNSVNASKSGEAFRLCPGDVIRLGTSQIAGQQVVFKIVPPEHLTSVQNTSTRESLTKPIFSTPQPVSFHGQKINQIESMNHFDLDTSRTDIYRASVRPSFRQPHPTLPVPHLLPPLPQHQNLHPRHQQTHSLDGYFAGGNPLYSNVGKFARPPLIPGRRESLSACSSPSNTSESSISTQEVWQNQLDPNSNHNRAENATLGQDLRSTSTAPIIQGTPGSSNRTSASRNSAEISSFLLPTVSIISSASNSNKNQESLSTTVTMKKNPEPSARQVSGSSSSSNSGPKSNSAPSVSDRLPCQLAYAPATLGSLLDWMVLERLSNVHCPLGASLTVYLMLRAICRQCDRWEAIESRQKALEANKDSSGQQSIVKEYKPVELSRRDLLPFQWRRRRRQLLGVLIGAVDRLTRHTTEKSLSFSTPPIIPTQSPVLPDVNLANAASLLANTSQLLHLIRHDVDLNTTFRDCDSPENPKDIQEAIESKAAWRAIENRLADLVEQAFERFSAAVIEQLHKSSIPALLSIFIRLVTRLEIRYKTSARRTSSSRPDQALADQSWPDLELINSKLEPENDPVMIWLEQVLKALATANTNPAIIVQIFARILHTLNAEIFNFLISKSSSNTEDFQTRITPAWGRVLYRWIHGSLNAWAMTHGLQLVTECYLQRLSQMADLMLADVKAVDSLYNLVVDLVRLNSIQVNELLSNYRAHCMPQEASNPRLEDGDDSGVEDAAVGTSIGMGFFSQSKLASKVSEYEFEDETSDFTIIRKRMEAINLNAENRQDELSEQCPLADRIPKHWIDFIVSGVTQVADRILAEEEHCSTDEDLTGGDHKDWQPELLEFPELHLPFLLPVDSYASDNTLNSQPYQQSSSNSDLNADTIITVQSVADFLKEPIHNGWCRLSMRPIKSKSGSSEENPVAPSWAVYLSQASENSTFNTEMEEISKNNSNIGEIGSEESRDSGLVRDVSVFNNSVKNIFSDNNSDHYETFDVIVPKIDSSLGLTILAAKSEDGQDLGIYIKHIVPGGGASCAEIVTTNGEKSPPCPLQSGDRIISVDGKKVSGLTQEQAASLVSLSGLKVRLTITRNLDLGRIAASLDLGSKQGDNFNIRGPRVLHSGNVLSLAKKSQSNMELSRTLNELNNEEEKSYKVPDLKIPDVKFSSSTNNVSIKRAATFSYSLATNLKSLEVLGAQSNNYISNDADNSDGSWDRKSELHSELLKTAKMLQTMRDELARCLDRKVTSPKLTEVLEVPIIRSRSALASETRNNEQSSPENIPVKICTTEEIAQVFPQPPSWMVNRTRLNSSLSHASLFSNLSANSMGTIVKTPNISSSNKMPKDLVTNSVLSISNKHPRIPPPVAAKPNKIQLQCRSAKSLGDLRETNPKVHDYPAVVAIKEAIISKTPSPETTRSKSRTCGSSARHIASLHDRLMEEQRRRTQSVERTRLLTPLEVIR